MSNASPDTEHVPTDQTPASASAVENESPQDDFSAEIPLTPELVEEEALRGDFAIKWVVILLASLMACTQIVESKTLLHVKTGQYLASHGSLPPATDIFSYTGTDRPWINLSWLFDLLLAGLYAVGSWQGITVLKIVVAGVVFYLLTKIARPNTPTWWNSICTAIALLVCHNRLTADTTLVTLLGITLTMVWLYRHQPSASSAKPGWWLVLVFFLWSNLDPRMYLGLSMLMLYGLGDLISRWLGITGPVGSLDRGEVEPAPNSDSVAVGAASACKSPRRYWAVVAACLIAALLNPSGWNSLLSPLTIYQAEYPAWQQYHPASPPKNTPVEAALRTLPSEAFQAFPATSPYFLTWNIATVAIGSLAAIAALLFILNWSRMDVGYLFVYFGFLLFGVAAIHEHAVAGLVFCVLAALNGQEWYAATFRQSYSVARGELLFSRGGRAVTVLALSYLALITGSGGLRGSKGSRTGWGIDPSLQSTLDSLQQQLADSLDDRPFHFRPSQGDLLIWIGQRSFVDSRLALFHHRNGDDLIDTHIQLRNAIVDGDVKKWAPDFETYRITHALPRLTQPRPDYTTLFGMLQSSAWRLTDVGAAAAVLYRQDIRTPELTNYISTHQIDAVKQAYKADTVAVLPRDKWVSKPSFYQRYLGVHPAPVPSEIQEAEHLLTLALALAQLPSQMLSEPRALVYVAIRKAQAGLVKNPDCSEGYRVLGLAYLNLSDWDSLYLLNDPRLRHSGLRYFQGLLALNQSLVSDPDDYRAHLLLAKTYQEAGKLDLAKREWTACDELLSRENNPNEQQLAEQTQIVGNIEQLDKQLQQAESEIEKALSAGANAIQVAGLASQLGCPLRALRHFQENPDALAGNVSAQQLRVTLLLESGRAQEAYDAAALLEEVTRQQSNSEWQSVAAMTHLAHGDYESALRLLRQARTELEQNGFVRLLDALAPRASTEHPQAGWPLTATATGLEVWPRAIEEAVQFAVSIAMIELEQGQVGKAAKTLRSALENNPNTAARMMIGYYLYMMTGEEIDELPPAETIPLLFEEDVSTPNT